VNDQPDCFETPDYPINEQSNEVGYDNSEAVNQFDINTKEVHDTFNGKYLNGKVASRWKRLAELRFDRFLCLDFSDNETKARGYVQHGIYQNVSRQIRRCFRRIDFPVSNHTFSLKCLVSTLSVP
jgi:hypothetical protein